MCEMCADGSGYCQNCGIMVCYDTRHGDDVIRPASSYGGDLLCNRCAARFEEEEREAYEEWGWMEFDSYA